jgi:hypothetical protein
MRGRVKVLVPVDSEDGSETSVLTEVARLGKGDAFGELALIRD